MLLVLDIGNTNIVTGLFKEKKLHRHFRMQTNTQSSADEYGMIINSFLTYNKLSFASISGVIISSVVPPLVLTFQRMCKRYLGLVPLIVDSTLDTGLDIAIDHTSGLGADRIVNAVAAMHKYGTPLIIIDFGTATTYCYVDENRRYCGGAIAPGLMIATEALYKRAAKLPYIELVMPKKVIGRNTISAMQAGVLYGYVGQVEGIVNRMLKEVNTKAKIIATGGLANLIAKETDIIEIVDPFLTLNGLQYIYELQSSR